MSGGRIESNKVVNVLCAMVLGIFMSFQNGTVMAKEFTAGSVLKNMETIELNAYVTGIIDGLAFSRYTKEGKKTDGGMKCIYDWFYNGGQTTRQIIQAFDKFKKHTPNAIVSAMINQKCGE